MNLLKKIFNPKGLSEIKHKKSDKSKYLPEDKLPTDEKFTYNFGGSLYQDDSFNDINQQVKRSFTFGLGARGGGTPPSHPPMGQNV